MQLEKAAKAKKVTLTKQAKATAQEVCVCKIRFVPIRSNFLPSSLLPLSFLLSSPTLPHSLPSLLLLLLPSVLSSPILPIQTSYHTAWYSVLNPIVEAARQLHPSKVWDDMSPKLYATFWALSLYDLYVPTSRYDDEIRKAREAIKELEEKLDMVTNEV